MRRKILAGILALATLTTCAVTAVACVDADADGICDVCTKAMPVEEEPHGFYAQIIKWIAELVEAFKAFLAAIKGDSIF